MAIDQPNVDNLKLRLSSMAVLGYAKPTKLRITSTEMLCFSIGQETSEPNKRQLKSPRL